MEYMQINQVFVVTAATKSTIGSCNRYLGHNSKGICALIRLGSFQTNQNNTYKKPCGVRGPYTTSLKSLVDDIESKNIYIVDGAKYEYPKMAVEFSESELKRLDEYKNIMGPIIKTPDILFDRKIRNKKFNEIANKFTLHPFTIRRLYYLYLYYGHNPIVFAPLYTSRGGLQKESKKRRGKLPEKENDRAKTVLLCDVRDILIEAAQKLYLDSPNTLKQSYEEMKFRHFSASERYPNFSQWYYIIRKLKDKGAIKILKKNKLVHPAKIMDRPVFGTAIDDVNGPGDRYEIDSTRLQIQLVSRFGRQLLIGEPNLYLVVDVWSGLIVGFALSLENPSFALAAEALRCCFTPKIRIFEDLGLPLGEKDWPCHHLPSRLMADRAELISNKAEIIPIIGIDLDIASPMRADMKGTVEGKISEFKNIGGFNPFPGMHIKFRTRRDPDGKKKAALTIIEMYIMVVYIILELNRRSPTKVPLSFNCPETTTLTRNDLFIWGLKHRPGFTKIFSEEWVASNLLAKGLARVKKDGIYFHGERYLTPRLNELGYLSKAKKDRSFTIEVRLNEHRGWELWFLDPETRKWVIAEHERRDFHDEKVTFFEIKDYKDAHKELVKNTSTETYLQNRIGRAAVNTIVNTAKNNAKIAKQNTSFENKKPNIKVNRLAEMVSLRNSKKSENKLQDQDDNVSDISTNRDKKNLRSETKEAINDISDVTTALWDND